MTDIDRIVRDSLTTAAESFRETPAGSARRRFEDLRRRRSRVHFVATAALVALAVGATSVVVARKEPVTKRSVIAPPEVSVAPGEMIQTATLSVGPNPTSIDTDVVAKGIHEGIYVGFAEGGVARIDPSTNEKGDVVWADGFETDLIEVEGGTFWAVGDGSLVTGWVAASGVGRARPQLYGFTAREVVQRPEGEATDLVVGPEAVYVGATATSEPRYAVFEYRPPDLSGDAPDFVEVSTNPHIDYGDGLVWVAQNDSTPPFSDSEGLWAVDFENPEGAPTRYYVEDVVRPTDVAFGAGAVWAYDDPAGPFSDAAASAYPRLVRVDPATREVTARLEMPGHFGWIEATEDLGVFVMSQVNGKLSRLFRVDPATGEKLGDPLEFGPGPFALASGFGSLWIADKGEDAVYRIEVGEMERPTVETTDPDETVEPEETTKPTDTVPPEEVPQPTPAEVVTPVPESVTDDQKAEGRAVALKAKLDRLIRRITRLNEAMMERRGRSPGLEERMRRLTRLYEKAARAMDRLARRQQDQ